MEGRWRPGERMVINHLAGDLKMSAIPVREAISRLAKEGLLEIRPHAGAIVSDVTPEAIREIFLTLESLEQSACRLLDDQHRAAVLSQLERWADRMERTVRCEEWFGYNRNFHLVIPEVCALSLLRSLMIRVGEEWERLRLLRFSASLGEDLKIANREHREFIGLIAEGTLNEQLAWVGRHNQKSLERYCSGLDEGWGRPRV